MNSFWAEMVGTALMIFLGNGVVAGVVLNDTKNHKSDWVVITIGWALAVTFAIYAVGGISGAHLNPAVTIAFAVAGEFDWQLVPLYIFAQMTGAFIGSCLVYFHYLPHWERTESAESKLAVFCTAPAIRHTTGNFISEFLGSFVLMFGLGAIGSNQFADGLNPIIVGALVLAIGHSLGGTTGYAINPARDLGPRVAHFFLPIPGKGESDWSYAWIPVIGPVLGGICGLSLHHYIL